MYSVLNNDLIFNFMLESVIIIIFVMQIGITGSALVPGSIYTDLVRAKFIGNPYYRFNDVEYRWVSRQNWTYSRNFNGIVCYLVSFA